MKWLRIAAGISVAVALVGFALYDIPGIVAGASESDGPFAVIVGSFVSDILALVAAISAWQGRRWGLVLLIVVNVYWVLQAIGGLLTAEHAGELVFSAVMLLLHVAAITFCLRREPVAVAHA
jgi:hypothetical protein